MTDETKVDSGGFVYSSKKVNIVGGEGARYGMEHEHPGITRRDKCADRIAASLVVAGRIASMIAAHKGVSDEDMQTTLSCYTEDQIVKQAYSLADLLIAEGRKC